MNQIRQGSAKPTCDSSSKTFAFKQNLCLKLATAVGKKARSPKPDSRSFLVLTESLPGPRDNSNGLQERPANRKLSEEGSLASQHSPSRDVSATGLWLSEGRYMGPKIRIPYIYPLYRTATHRTDAARIKPRSLQQPPIR